MNQMKMDSSEKGELPEKKNTSHIKVLEERRPIEKEGGVRGEEGLTSNLCKGEEGFKGRSGSRYSGKK